MAKYVWDEKKQDYVLDSGTGGGSGKSYDRYTWDEKKQDYVKSGKFGGTFGVTPADPEYDAKAYASAAAQDIYDANRFVPSFGKTLTDNMYKIGGSKNISQGNQVQDIGNVAGSSGIWQRNLNAGKEQLGLTDEEYETLLAASEDDEAYAKAMVNIAKARTGGLSTIDMTGMPKAQQQELQALGNLDWRDGVYGALAEPAAMGKQTPNIESAFDPTEYVKWVASGGADDELMQTLLKERETGADYLEMYSAYSEEQLKQDLLRMQSYYSPQNPYKVNDDEYQDVRRRVYAALGTDYDEASRTSGGKDNQWVMDALNTYRTGKNSIIESAFGGDESMVDAYMQNVEGTEAWLNYVAQQGKKLDKWKAESDEAVAKAQAGEGYEENRSYIPDTEFLDVDMSMLTGSGGYETADGEYLNRDQYIKRAEDATLAALVDAGNDPIKLDALQRNIELLPGLAKYGDIIPMLPYLDAQQKEAFFAAWNNGNRENAMTLLSTFEYGANYKRVKADEAAQITRYNNAGTLEKVGMNVQSVGQNVSGALLGLNQAVQSLVNPEDLARQHEYSGVYDGIRSANLTRQLTGGEIAAKTEGTNIPWTDRNLWEAVYHGVMSGADSATIGAMLAPLGPVVQAAVMGGMSFANERMNKLEQGYSDSDANIDAWVSAAIEGASEYLPFDIWGKNSSKWFIKGLAGTSAETLGEMASEFGSAAYDEAKYGHGRNELRAQGYGFDDENLWLKWLDTQKGNIAAAGIGGLVSGGGMSFTNAAVEGIQNRTLGNNLTNNDGIEPMLDLADSLPLDDVSKDIADRLRAEMAERGKGDKAETETDDAASITAEDAEAEARESEMADRDSAEASELDKGEKTDEAIEESATVTKEDAEAAARAEEMTERDRAERADEGKTTEETDAAAVTEEDAEAAVRTARDRGESADMTRGGRAEAEIDDSASVTEEDVRALTEAEAREWLNDEASWAESDEATETDAAAKDVAEEPATINADAIASDYADTAAKRGEIEAREAERQQRRNERKAARDKRRKAVTKAEKGYLYRQILANLDKGAQQIVKDNFSRDMRREIEAVGYTGNAKEAAKVLSDFINGEVTPRALELLDGFESLRNIALSYVGKIEMRNDLYRQAGELSERAQKGYVKPEATTAEEGADEIADTEEDDLGYEEMEDDGEDSLRMLARDTGIEVNETPESTYDGKAVTVEDVKITLKGIGIYDYTLTVKDADGNTYEVPASEVSVGQNDAAIVDVAYNARRMGVNADIMIKAYGKGQNPAEYAREFKRAVKYGDDGRNLDAIKASGEFKTLTPEQIGIAYNVGHGVRTMRSEVGARRSAAGRSAAGVTVGKVDTSGIDMRELKPNQRAAIRAMASFSKAAGFNLRFVESKADAEGRYRTENGSWDPETLTLTLDVHAGSDKSTDFNYAMMHTAGHELTHYIRQFADTDLWNAYQDFVIGHLSTKEDAVFNLDDRIDKLIENAREKGRRLTRDGAIEEIIADASGEALMNITEADIQSIAETNPTLLNKIKNFFKKWISNLKKRIADAYAGTEAKTAEAKQMQDVVDEMSKRWNELFVNATKNKNKAVASETTVDSVEDAVESDADVNPDEKRSLNYRHIDQRTFDSVKDTDTELFVSDAEEAQIGMAAAANILLADLENSIPGQKVWLSDGEVSGQKRQTSELLGRMKDDLGLTWDKLRQNLQQFAEMESADALPRNSATNRRIELYLHEMLTEGYTALDGTQITPWNEYVEWSQSIEGAEGKKKYSPVEGAVAFEDYAWPGEVKYSIRELSDGTKYTMLDASEIQIDGSTDADSIGRKARLYMRKHYRGKILPVGATKGAYIRNDSINEYTNSAKFLDDNDYGNKMIASTELDNLLKSSVYKNWRPDNGRHPDAVRGWTTWKTIFAVKPKNAASVIVYEGDVKIKRIARGDLFYDITKIKNITNSTIGRRIIAESQSVGDNLSIPKQKESVKYSERDTDQTQTDAFKRWFGDSKVVNADGTPKVLYHQTNADFSAFDVGRQGAGYLDSEMPSGIYMKDFPDTIKLGPDYKESTQMDLYATIKNPLVFVDRADANRFWKKHVPGYAKMQKELDELNKRYGDEHGKWEALWFDEDDAVSERAMEESDRILEEWTEQENSKRREMHVAIDKYLASSQYDGIILEQDQGTGGTVKTYVALKGTQVKSASKNIGTFDPGDSDIRYQERDYSELSDRELLVQALETDLKPVEREHLERYAGRVSDLDKQQRDLEELHTQIAQMRAEGKTATNSSELLTALDKAKKLRGKIDRADAKLKEIESADMIREVVRRTREETRRKTAAQVRARADERMRKEVERVRGIGERKVKRVKDSHDTDKYRKQILADVRRIHGWIASPTSKGYAPEFMREPLAELIDSIDFTSARGLKGGDPTKADAKFTEALDKMREAVTRLNKAYAGLDEGAEAFSGYIDLPADFADEFDALVSKIKGVISLRSGISDAPFFKMSADQLHEMAKMFRILKSSIMNVNRLVANSRYDSAQAVSTATIDDMNEMSARKKTHKALELFNSVYNWKNATPIYAFERLGRGGRAIFEGLQDGWDRMARNSARLIEYAKKTFKSSESKAWSGEITNVTLDSGDTIQMTTAQKMSLYCHTKREQSMGHLMGGGIRVADIDGKHGMKITQAENYVLTEGDIARIIDSLTDRQREVADKLQAFMNDVCAAWGNEISMKRFGFEQMTEKHYFPIETDANNRRSIDEAKDGSTSMFRLLNMSSLKPLTPNANNAIVIKDIFDVFSDHASDMAKYNALALPILDFIKWYNYVERNDIVDADGMPTGKYTTRSTQKALERAFGKDAKSYLTTFIRNLNAEHDGGINDGLFASTISKAKSAAVGFNTRVYGLQITSLPRAAFVINPKYLMAGAAKLQSLNPKNAVIGTEAQEKVGILQWKKLGFYSTDIARSTRGLVKRNDGLLDKVRDIQMAPAGWGDNWVSNIIYEAVKAEMSDTHPTVTPGSETYDALVNKRVREIVYKTQVVDSTMTRSELMRSKGLASVVTAFMSEPTITINMLNESIQKAVELGRKGGNTKQILRATGGLAVRAATTWVITSFVTALFESAWDAMRDDDEYERFVEKFWNALWGEKWHEGNFVQNLNPITMVPYLNDAWSIVIEGYEDNSLMMQVATQFKTFWSAFKSYLDGKGTLYNAIYKGGQAASSLTGVAGANLIREVSSAYNTFLAPAWDTPKWQTYADTESTAAKAYYGAVKESRTDDAEYYMQRMEAVDADMGKVSDKMVSLIGDDFVAGNITETNARKWLKDEAGMADDKINTKMRDWNFKAETGISYSEFKGAYTAGIIAEAEAKRLLKKYRGYDDNKVYFTLLEWKGGEDWSRYDAFLDAVDVQGNFAAEARKLLDHGVNKSDIASEIAKAYKDAYREIHGTFEGDRLLEYLLDVYESIGYDRDYERKYITKNWLKD